MDATERARLRALCEAAMLPLCEAAMLPLCEAAEGTEP